MSFRRLLSAVRSARDALTRGAPMADGLFKSLVSLVVILCIAVSSPQSASAKPFAFSFPASWSLAGLVGGVGARSEDHRREPAGVKPYTERRVSNDTLRMIYFHDQTVAVVELGLDKLLLNCELIETYDEDDTSRLLRQLSSINRPLAINFPQMTKLMSQCQQFFELLVLKLLLKPKKESVSDEDDTSRLLRQLSSINRPLAINFPQMTKLMSQCQQVDGVEGSEGWAASRRRADWRERGAARLRAGGQHAGLLGGSPLSLLQGIIPGTKWCGTGDIAADYHDLGSDRPLDRCCRTHDLCPSKVRAFSTRYNLTNNSLYSKSHCTCDDMLFECLKATNTSASHLMGHIYFNIVQVPCFEDLPSGRRFREAKQGF
ncbi:hypothetical protein KGM_207444 [Danaus plexippus plexippus]|uniref:Phospholipase A2 n=1 Tax=Danaus plexippus plexippus TaxID=278856 RepID=A0A212FHD2_DANPL|nr:hypothetical protein KGM_207444 [Danaus plexippus plexippus]